MNTYFYYFTYSLKKEVSEDRKQAISNTLIDSGFTMVYPPPCNIYIYENSNIVEGIVDLTKIVNRSEFIGAHLFSTNEKTNVLAAIPYSRDN